ncbi:TrbG/VirB9 family P-type conjugative transfer protein [Pelagerythrobacter sp.]|uniref:TrbG/VirB9 family P-type conjugative transfer protein n=1 Tax=Pelagerythrobacter sp. TaxID=2800702 RepID=UPI0035B29201
MIRLIAALAAALVAIPCAAQTMPRPDIDNPRLQTVQWSPGSEYLLTALPMTGLTVLFEPGEQVERVTLDAPRVFDVKVSAERDGLLVLPQIDGAAATMLVATDRRDYRMQLQTGEGLMAAYLVQFAYQPEADAPFAEPVAESWSEPTGEVWTYRLSGDRAVRPLSISDDGRKTRIVFGPDQPLPAVFAIGPGGEEQVAGGYMRGEVYEIDRVWQELVFRIDKEKATAERRREPENADG